MDIVYTGRFMFAKSFLISEVKKSIIFSNTIGSYNSFTSIHGNCVMTTHLNIKPLRRFFNLTFDTDKVLPEWITFNYFPNNIFGRFFNHNSFILEVALKPTVP